MAKKSLVPSVTEKTKVRTRFLAALAFLLFFVIALFSLLNAGNNVGNNANIITASADTYTNDAFKVNQYTADVTVNTDRTIRFHEKISVTIRSNGSQFYRSLSIDSGDAYFDISATRTNSSGVIVDDSFSVINNPDKSGYIDIVCYGGVSTGNRWTYDFYYTMRSTERTADGMTIDVVGGGWTVPLHDVTVTMHFPSTFTYKVYSDAFGGASSGSVKEEKIDENTLKLTTELLEVVYNKTYGDNSAKPITIKFTLQDGVMDSYAAMLLKSPSFWIILIVAVAAVVVTFFLVKVFKKDHEMVTVVNVKPPEGMDPLLMGLTIDGNVDTEDITSMIYYFAEQGYLTIELPADKKDEPILHRTDKEIPSDIPSWQRVLLDGLFDKGNRDTTTIADLQEHFYTSANKAKMLVTARKGGQYEKKSIVGMVICAILSLALYELVPFFVGLIRIGGGYTYKNGVRMGVVLVLCMIGFFMVERRRYKDKTKSRIWKNVLLTIALALAGLVYTRMFARHILNVYERLFIAIAATLCAVMAPHCISRTEKYTQALGGILGFKDFILYTEEDKLKVMLEEEPQLYYDVLPYAQVLGISDIWESKFQSIVINQPAWASGNVGLSVFDYVVFSSVLRTALTTAMVAPTQSRGGTFIGGGGGGGHFGGFSGGGHGGGGGGIR